MEDSHAAVLDLDGSEEISNAFFAVYDGHGGSFLSPTILTLEVQFQSLGSTVAKFAGQNVHKRLITEESYKEKNWEMALKKAFLGTDEDFLAGTSFLESVNLEKLTPGKILHIHMNHQDVLPLLHLSQLIIRYMWSVRERPRSSFAHVPQANAGDSRSVLSVMGKVKPLSSDHKPTNPCKYLPGLVNINLTFCSGEIAHYGSGWLC